MKKYLSKTFLVFIILVWVFTYIPGISLAEETADKNMAPENKTGAVVDNIGNLENILFEKLPGKERIQLVVSRQPVVDVKSKTSGSFLIKLENMTAPESLCHSLGEGELNNVISVTPSQQLIKGKQFVYLTIDIKKLVPYAIRQEGQNLFVDFNVSSLVEKKVRISHKKIAKKKVVAKATEDAAPKNDIDNVKSSKSSDVQPPIKEKTFNKDKIISIDFQDADIKSVLRLMAEYGNISIVWSDDVKANVTLSMKDVPWIKALDTILEVNSMSKQQEDNVIIVTTMARKKLNDDAKLKAIDDANKRKEQEHKEKAEKGLLRQVLIEAKIVEATEDFVRDLGVKWGFGNQQNVPIGGSNYGLGLTGGSNTATTNQYQQAYPSQIPFGNTVDGTTTSPLSMNDAGEPDIIGIVYDAGIPDGSLCRLVVSGWCDIYVNAGGANRGDYIRNRAGGDPGSSGMAIAEAVPGSPFATDKHFQEVGHVLQSRVGAGLVRCVVHFN